VIARVARANAILTLALIIAGNAFRGATPAAKVPAELAVVNNGWWIRLSPLYALTFAVVGALIISRRPANRVGWVAAGIGLLTAVYQFGLGYITYGQFGPGGARLPALGFAISLENWEWALPVVLMLFFLPLVFPNGEPISPRWWWLTVLVAIGFVLAFLQIYIGQLLALVGCLLAQVNLVIRYRRGSQDERQQIRWFGLSVAVLAVVAVLGLVVGALVYHNNTVVFNPIFDVLIPLAFTGVGVSIGVAVLKYRLYDIEFFIRQTLVYGTLVVLISIVYFIGVVTVGSRLGPFPTRDPAAGVAIGAIVAILFQPVRARLQRLANRLVYGKRANPYEVLSDFNRRVSEMYSSDELPMRMARALAEGTSASSATVWLRIGNELRRAASWPSETSQGDAIALPDGEVPPIPGSAATAPVRHQGELLGALAIAKREALTAVEGRLLNDLAREAGLVLKNARLTAELMDRLQELQASRQRLVSAQDTERRRLERNLHDGAQQNLVALKLKIALAKGVATKDPAKAQTMLDELTHETDDAIETLRELARGLYPPILAQQGLVAALQSQARRSPVPVEINAPVLGRYPQNLEATVYFCCLEALQNIAKHAEASKATVTLSERDEWLKFAVADDGRGLDPLRARSGSGMQNMRDRLAVIGGTLNVEPGLESGTIVTGLVPLSQPA